MLQLLHTVTIDQNYEDKTLFKYIVQDSFWFQASDC